MILLALGLANAAPLTFAVTGTSADAVAVMVQTGSSLVTVNCGEAALGWSCSTVDVPAGEYPVGVMASGRLFKGGLVTVPDEGFSATLQVAGGGVTVSPGAVSSSGASGSSSNLIARFIGLEGSQPPVLRVTWSGGSTQLSCHDDGSFPERKSDDGNYGCGGSMPASVSQATFGYQDVSGKMVSLGTGSWTTSGLRFVTVYASGQEATSTKAFSVRLRTTTAKPDREPPEAPGPEPVPPEPPEPPPPPEPVPPELRSDVTSIDIPTETVAGLPPSAALSEASTAAGAPPVARDGELPYSPGGYRWAAVLITLGLGGIGGWVFGRMPRRAVRGLSRIDQQIFGSNGPSVGPILAIRTAPDGVEKLVSALAAHRRVVLVGEGTGSGVFPIYRTASEDRLEVERAVRDLARTPGAPLALVVIGRHTVIDPGALAADPVVTLFAGAPDDTWRVLVYSEGIAPSTAQAWVLEDEAWRRG